MHSKTSTCCSSTATGTSPTHSRRWCRSSSGSAQPPMRGIPQADSNEHAFYDSWDAAHSAVALDGRLALVGVCEDTYDNCDARTGEPGHSG